MAGAGYVPEVACERTGTHGVVPTTNSQQTSTTVRSPRGLIELDHGRTGSIRQSRALRTQLQCGRHSTAHAFSLDEPKHLGAFGVRDGNAVSQ